MNEQNFANHGRVVKGFHFALSTLLFGGVVGAVINCWQQRAGDGLFSALLITVLFFSCFFIFWFMRAFPLKAQDRAIRAEESLRYFILTQKTIDSRITIGQIIALRFAPDEEFVLLADKAAKENLSPKEIKIAIKNWRADHHRV